jgi:catechol 2,3-dioxygenase-like lactoylglutathione lyase family enzyme
MGAYERAAEDVGNLVALEHVNVAVPDQRLATLFYCTGLGFTRDPYLMVGEDNMWVNVGRQQFHLPTRGVQVVRGHVGIVVPDLAALAARLQAVREKLAGTRFAFRAQPQHLTVICPWGNVLRCHAPHPRFGRATLGIAYVQFAVPRGTAAGIARFYREVLGAPARLARDRSRATVRAGPDQWLAFHETARPLAPYDGHHIALYVADFSGPHRYLARRGLITEESDAHQYRFEALVDPRSGERLYELQHEVRSLRHPLWGRALVNRNPGQSARAYRRGRDAWGE